MDALATRSRHLLDLDREERLQLEFDLARLELVEARLEQQQKDTPAARSRVAECRSRVDKVLDTWNAVVPPAR